MLSSQTRINPPIPSGWITTTETTQYTWDAQDRLASVTLPNGSVHRYAYDYRTRRADRRMVSAALAGGALLR
jgi:YD repeat-containing protein